MIVRCAHGVIIGGGDPEIAKRPSWAVHGHKDSFLQLLNDLPNAASQLDAKRSRLPDAQRVRDSGYSYICIGQLHSPDY